MVPSGSGLQTFQEEDLPDPYREVFHRVERDGWANVRWQAGYTLLHWAAKKKFGMGTRG